MRVIVVEDSPLRKEAFLKRLQGHDVTIVSNFRSACIQLEKQTKFDVAYLDHDLMEYDNSNRERTPYGYREHNGEDVVKFIIHDLDPEKRPTSIVIHSRNETGALVMQELLAEAGIRATLDPYTSNPQ